MFSRGSKARFVSLLLLSLILSGVFTIGVGVGHYKWPPFSLLTQIKTTLNPVDESEYPADYNWLISYKPTKTPREAGTCTPHSDGAYRYRPNLSSLKNLSSLTYSDLSDNGVDFKYKNVLLNDFEYYVQDKLAKSQILHFSENNQQSEYVSQLTRRGILVAYVDMLHQPHSSEAVLLVHGNSLIPDDFFNADDTYYSNSVGLFLFQQGFDVFAPYVTHDSRFQNARRRLASLSGDKMSTLDLKRVKLLFMKLSEKYETVHVIGASYGGYLASQLMAELQNDPKRKKKLGLVLSIEGWHTGYMMAVDEKNLFHWNYEMVFPGISSSEFEHPFDTPTFFVAYGKNSKLWYRCIYESAKNYSHQIIEYDGGHEFSREAISQALNSYREIKQ